MKYLKTFESNKELLEELDTFYENYKMNKESIFYEKGKSQYNFNYTRYKIPEEIKDDLDVLYFLYQHDYIWKSSDKQINNYIKRKVKEQVIKTILDKIQQDSNLYLEIRRILDENPNFGNSRRFGYIQDSTIRFIFFLLDSVERKTPDFIKDSNKYNL